MTQSYKTEINTADDVIVDLSRYSEALLNYQDISDALTQEEERRLVDYVKTISNLSYEFISKRYDSWQQADRAHDVYIPPDATRFREKAVIADTRAIADTVLTYMMAAITGRNPMFQLEGLTRKSRQASVILERLMHQHMRRNAGEARIAQLFLDSIRYGFAPTKITWDSTRNTNLIRNNDPRRTFPDPRVSWGDWENSQFIVFSDFLTTSALIQSGQYPKLNKYPGLRRPNDKTAAWKCHSFNRESVNGLSVDQNTARNNTESTFKIGKARIVDEAWVVLGGYQIGMPSINQIWLNITILDEEVVVALRLNPYGQNFPSVIGGFFYDSHKTFSQSLYDLLQPLHEIGTWLLRSRVDNVQAALNNLIFADPTQISIPDLIDRNPWGVVRTLPGSKPGDGVFIAQVPDVTRGHWNDIAALSDMKQRISAASDAQQGMPTSDGIRTATEIQRLSQLGSQRLGVLARIISATTIRPAVRMMVSNIQDALSYQGSIRIDETDSSSMLSGLVEDGYLDFDVRDLQGQIDYLVVDGTLPVEPTRSPETWMNILQVLNNSGLQMEYKAGKIIEEAIRAMGVSDIDQFKISDQERSQGMTPSQQMAMMEKMRGASVMPEEDLQNQVQRGNLIPISQARQMRG